MGKKLGKKYDTFGLRDGGIWNKTQRMSAKVELRKSDHVFFKWIELRIPKTLPNDSKAEFV